MSWLESELCGTHPRTNGTRLFRRRVPAPITEDPCRVSWFGSVNQETAREPTESIQITGEVFGRITIAQVQQCLLARTSAIGVANSDRRTCFRLSFCNQMHTTAAP